MTDRTADKLYDTRPNSGRDSFIIADGVVLAAGTLVQLGSGYADHHDGTGNFLGIVIGGDDRAGDGVLTGETSDAKPPEAFVDTSGVIVKSIAVAGTATQAKVGDLVYAGDSDLATATLTQPTTDYPIGILHRFVSVTDCDVKLFTPMEHSLGIEAGIGLVMDLSVQATNRNHDFAYLNAAPHMEYWRRGESVPQGAMDATQFNVPVYEWAKRVGWSKFDRHDDQTQSLMTSAAMAGESAGLLPERFFFDLLNAGGGGGTASTLPIQPTAPDGAAFFATTAGGAARFGATNGNLLTGTGITTIHDVLNDYYGALTQFMAFEDGQGQPMLSPETIASGVVIIHASADTEVFEQAFLQQRQGMGLDNTGAIGGVSVDAAAVSNIVQDASRNVNLWGSPRLATGDWYVFLANPPKQATFLLTRSAVQEFSSMESDNNGDHTRDTAEEYIQWEERSGAGIALPYSAICINN
jgi:hypothetical protein